MIERYTRPEMARIWSEENKFSQWLRVEITACDAWAELGEIPQEAAEKIRGARFDMARINEVLAETHHDVTAFLRSVQESLGEGGRTHGVHAEPITFGLKLALWAQEMKRNQERLAQARVNVAVGKLSGAVGTFATVPPAVEASVCAKLGLQAAPLSNQVLQRDRHAQYVTTLAICAGSLEKFATEIRGLQRTAVLEAAGPFAAGETGRRGVPPNPR